jgi:hypothetical protein
MAIPTGSTHQGRLSSSDVTSRDLLRARYDASSYRQAQTHAG